MNTDQPRFGRLVIIERTGNNSYRCQCDCGNEAIVEGYNLRRGHTRSCGCLQREHARINMRIAQRASCRARALRARMTPRSQCRAYTRSELEERVKQLRAREKQLESLVPLTELPNEA